MYDKSSKTPQGLSALPLANFHQISHGAFCQRDVDTLFNGSAPLKNMAVKPVMVKTLKIFFFSSTKTALRLHLGIQHRGFEVYQVCLNDETRMTFDLFIVWSNLRPSCYGNTGRMLHGICKYAIAVFIRWANCGPWISCSYLLSKTYLVGTH